MANRTHFRNAGAAVLAGLGALMLMGGIYLLCKTPVYEAVTRVKAEKDPVIEPFPGAYQGFDPFWVQTEFEAIQSKVVLFPVITNLNLTARWSVTVPEVYPILRDRLLIRQARNSSIIEIRARSQDPNEAAELANAVAASYRDYRLQQLRLAIAASKKEIPVTSPVEILDVADPPQKPCRPSRRLGFLLLVSGCLSELVAPALFTSRKT
jgi:uncharacterized protein involved in exopolysaccharide biosynthesis